MRSKIIDSSCIPASIPSRWCARRRETSGAGAVEGGSTITQQLARTLFLSNSRTWGRKLKEAGIAWMIEQQLTKQQILELYLNRVYLSAGVYGVEPMARRLFGKPSRDVTLAEAALIAGLIRAPSVFSPWSNLDAAVRRSHVVLGRMREERAISGAEERQATRAQLLVRPYPRSAIARSGYAKEFLRQRFRDRFGGSHPPDWQVHTTFERALQLAAEQAVETGLQRLNRRDLQAALVAVDPDTGNLLALVGGRDFASYPYNRATRSRRQPGSAFKPFVYAAALERGLSPVSILRGLNSIAPQGPDEWAPHNARGESADELTLRAALLASDNRAAVMLQQQVGSQPVLTLASRAGLEGLPDVPSLALGTGVVTPLELTLAYSMFPNGGFAVKPLALPRVLDAEGGVALEEPAERRQVLSPETAFQIVSMLQDVIDRGTGARARALGVDFPAAGKTGTTDDFKDAWFVGFSNRLVAGVWVGFDQPTPIAREAFGARVALPIWADFMRRAARSRPSGRFAVPAGLRDEVLCSVTYLRPAEGCPTYVEYFKPGDAIPNRTCPLHQITLQERASRAIADMLRDISARLRGIFRK
ncbi:MAG: transglycosylase domain-containing protein [Acidobacteria bacterium]|nr:transglycosylase domain-containing protein [Acidobacteriota bacterium]